MTNNSDFKLLAIDLSLKARSKMKDQKIDSILRYATNTDADVFEQHKRISFFIRKPYVGELEFDLEFERIDKKILEECCSILCKKDGGIEIGKSFLDLTAIPREHLGNFGPILSLRSH